MALPADFSKIFGSTATGGLTPINDVDYAKGWEFVGSNPPTKNDFSYLQNLSDLKSQWLYSNKLQRANPFGDIKSDGTVTTALANLGLGTAATRNVGTAENQIPSMASWTTGTNGNGTWVKLPNGFIIQTGYVVGLLSGGLTITFPTAFTKEPAYSLTPTSSTNLIAVASSSSATTINNVMVFTVAGAQIQNGIHWMAMGF